MMTFYENGLCVEYIGDDCTIDFEEPKAEKQPEIPAEVHNPRPISGDTCMAATKALCEGNAR